MKKYNEFRKEFVEKRKKAGATVVPQEEVSKAWELYKTGDTLPKKTIKNTSVKKERKQPLPVEIKAINKRLTEKQKLLNQLRLDKKAGKDVASEITKALKYLEDNRQKKKDLLKTLGLL